MQAIVLSLLIFSGFPLLALAFYNRPTIAKTIGTGGIILGCLLGLFGIWDWFHVQMPHVLIWTWQKNLTISLSMDRLTAFFLIPIFLITSITSLYGFNYLHDDSKGLRIAVNQLFLGLLTASMVLVVLANDMVTFLLAWEFMSISSCFLVLYDYEQKETRHASYIYFIFTQAGAMFIFAAFGILYSMTGSFGFEFASAIPQHIKLLVFFIAFAGYGSKAGVFPLHIWLPHAHPAAPSHVSALMSGVMIKMGIYGMLRLYLALSPDSAILGRTILAFGIISGVLGVVYAMGQHNIKRLLAYHSIENIGIILIGIGLGMMGVSANNPAMAIGGFTGGLMHVLNHAIFKSLLFMGAGSVSHGTGTLAIEKLGGLIKRMRVTGITFLIGAIAICGLPPLNGFVSEFLIYNGAFQSESLGKLDFLLTMLAVIALAVIGGLAVACFTKVMGIVFLGEPRTEEAKKAHEASSVMLYSMWILSILCVAIGLAPVIFVKPAALATTFLLSQLTGRTAYDVQMNAIMAMSTNISLGVALFLTLSGVIVFLRKVFYRSKKIQTGPTWGCGFTRATPRIQYTGASFAASILEFYRPVAPIHEEIQEPDGVFPSKSRYRSHIQDIAETFALQRIALSIVRFMRSLRWIQHGSIQVYIGYILLAMLALIFITWLWR